MREPREKITEPQSDIAQLLISIGLDDSFEKLFHKTFSRLKTGDSSGEYFVTRDDLDYLLQGKILSSTPSEMELARLKREGSISVVEIGGYSFIRAVESTRAHPKISKPLPDVPLESQLFDGVYRDDPFSSSHAYEQ